MADAKTFEILARRNPNDLDASFGTRKASRAYDVINSILGDYDNFDMWRQFSRITAAAVDDWDEQTVVAFRYEGGWVINQYDGNGGKDEIGARKGN